MREKLEKEMREKVESRKQKVESQNKKLKKLTNNQVNNNFRKIITKN